MIGVGHSVVEENETETIALQANAFESGLRDKSQMAQGLDEEPLHHTI